ncbi:MAG: replicative DNA helicase [Bdellovibrionaceae bacterium]|nr:replicative DNA helicase [Pseudobdellovibrionaceae bacterium]|tara:strand:+ start:2402 stop:4171 length:1770 start_codon:yes stop_codon:yes gene_type:complete
MSESEGPGGFFPGFSWGDHPSEKKEDSPEGSWKPSGIPPVFPPSDPEQMGASEDAPFIPETFKPDLPSDEIVSSSVGEGSLPEMPPVVNSVEPPLPETPPFPPNEGKSFFDLNPSFLSGAPSKKKGGKVPPHHIEAERSVLGAVLVQNEAVDTVLEVGLDSRDFYVDAHQKIFEVAFSLNEQRKPIDLVTMTTALRDRNWFDTIGGTAYLTGLIDDAFSVGNVETYAQIVLDKSILRKLVHVCQESISEAYDGVENVEAFVDVVEGKVFTVGDKTTQKAFAGLRTILLENMKTIEDLALRKTDVPGLETGFTAFDRVTTGLHPGQVMVLAARPGMGKTSWFISALQHAAVVKGSTVALFSLEMAKEELGLRFLSGLSRVDSRRLKTGQLADRDFSRLADAADKLAKSNIFIDDTPGVTVMDIRARCRRLVNLQGKIDLVVIDYLQLMRGTKASSKEGSREREIADISRGLKELAKELKVPVIALSQLNRGVESRQDKRPTLADLRESGAIEQDADLVCFIHREDYYDKNAEEKGIAEIIVAKNRAGETKSVRLAWLGQYTLFANLAEDEAGTPVNHQSSNQFDPSDITL